MAAASQSIFLPSTQRQVPQQHHLSQWSTEVDEVAEGGSAPLARRHPLGVMTAGTRDGRSRWLIVAELLFRQQVPIGAGPFDRVHRAMLAHEDGAVLGHLLSANQAGGGCLPPSYQYIVTGGSGPRAGNSRRRIDQAGYVSRLIPDVATTSAD